MAAQRVLPNYQKLVVILVFGAVVYNEFAVFFSATLRWPSFPDADETLRILFVADPQLLGIQHEHPFPVGALATWDSDRYLGKSFSWAVSAYDPQIVVFLGDLLDEGSESDDAAFRSYVDRFKAIYDFRSVKTSVYVAGDNDIGGDGGDPVTAEKMARFRDYFPSKPYYMFRGTSGVDISSSDEGIRKANSGATTVEIIPVNLLTQRDPSAWSDVPQKEGHVMRLVVSHLPVMPTPTSEFTTSVLRRLEPTVLLSAHDHRGMDYLATKKSGISNGNVTFFSQVESDQQNEPLRVKPASAEKTDPKESSEDADEEFLHEIVVPTCSYRTGFKEMAYGLGIVNMKQSKPLEFLYVNLWLPSRFALLYLYVATVLCSIALICVDRCSNNRRGRGDSRSERPTPSSSPSPTTKYTKLV